MKEFNNEEQKFIKILSINKGLSINWNNFSIELPENFSGTCHIYIDGLNGDSQQDLEKIARIKSISGLQMLVISSNDFRVAEYFNVLLKNFNIKKHFDLLNDLEIKDRAEIKFF